MKQKDSKLQVKKDDTNISFKECIKVIVVCLTAIGGLSVLIGFSAKLIFKITLFKGSIIGLVITCLIILLTKAWQPANLSEADDEEEDDD